jgi:hypothetical protein
VLNILSANAYPTSFLASSGADGAKKEGKKGPKYSLGAQLQEKGHVLRFPLLGHNFKDSTPYYTTIIIIIVIYYNIIIY